mgnify:CR=1 FL=1
MALVSAPWIDVIYLKTKKEIAAVRYMELQQEEGGIYLYELKRCARSLETESCFSYTLSL